MSAKPELLLSFGFLVIIVGIYTWDAFAVWQWQGPDKTVSSVLREWAGRQPILPFAAGVLIGHLFW